MNYGKRTKEDLAHFYSTALGSLTEVQNDTFKPIADQTVVVSKLLNGLIKSSRSHTS